jgi:hypothetical protein
MFNPLKLAAIFNSATKVSIFSIDPFNISISFNSGTFDFFSQNALNSYSGEPSTVISAKSGRIPTKTGKLFFSLFFFFLISASLNSSKKISLAGSMASEKRVRRIPANSWDSSQFFRFQRNHC